jgi:hypothetical protein
MTDIIDVMKQLTIWCCNSLMAEFEQIRKINKKLKKKVFRF